MIFGVVLCLLVYVVAKFCQCRTPGNDEPPQVYGRNQIEVAWTVIPTLIVLVFFLTKARVIQSIQDGPPPEGTLEVLRSGISFGAASIS